MSLRLILVISTLFLKKYIFCPSNWRMGLSTTIPMTLGAIAMEKKPVVAVTAINDGVVSTGF